jgi:hypothetical protein
MQRIDEIVKNLNETKGKVAFVAAFEMLRGLSAAEARAIAKAFTMKSARTKTEALGLIWKRHYNLVSAARSAGTTGSRLAG